MNKKIALILCTLLISSSFTFAQNKSDSLIMRDLLLEKDYSPQIENAGKIYQNPATEAIKTNKQEVKFATSANRLSLDKDFVPLQAAEAKVDFPAQNKWGYARLGTAGLRLLGDAQVNILHQERQRLELNWNSHMQRRPIPLSAYNFDNHNQASLAYQYHFDRSVLRASLSEAYDSWNYADFGYGKQQARSSDSHLQLAWASKPWGKDFNYDIQAESYLFYINPFEKIAASDSYTPINEKALEYEVDLSAKFSYRIEEDLLAHTQLTFKHLGYGMDSHLNDLYWFDLHPSIDYRWKLWQFSLGAHLSDIIGKESKIKLAATASAARNIGEKAAFQLSIDGGERVFSLRESFHINPYLTTNDRIEALYSPLKAQADIQWNPFDVLQVSAVAGYQHIRNLTQITATKHTQTSPEQNHVINFAFKQQNADIAFVGAGVAFNYTKMFRLSANTRYLHANKDLAYLPTWTIDAALDFRPIEKLSLSMVYHAALQRHIPLENAKQHFHGITTCLTYQLSKRWDIFLQTHPYSSKRFMYWNHNYSLVIGRPSLGASYSF